MSAPNVTDGSAPRYAPGLPILTRDYQLPRHSRFRFSPSGDAFEGVEMWLPECLPIVQSSLIELEAYLLIDNRRIEFEGAAGRFRSVGTIS